MFQGKHEHSVDEKNRFKVPATFREKLGIKTFIIESPYNDERCLYLYPEAEWDEIVQTFMRGETQTPEQRRMKRKILAGVVCAEVDKGGRITLNAGLKAGVGIESEVFLIGNGKHIEIWSKEEWNGEFEILAEQSTVDIGVIF